MALPTKKSPAAVIWKLHDAAPIMIIIVGHVGFLQVRWDIRRLLVSPPVSAPISHKVHHLLLSPRTSPTHTDIVSLMPCIHTLVTSARASLSELKVYWHREEHTTSSRPGGVRMSRLLTESRLAFISRRGSFAFSSGASSSCHCTSSPGHSTQHRSYCLSVNEQQPDHFLLSSTSPLLPSACGLVMSCRDS
ncbi:hypothetical protein H4582DRAFT_1036127 [Lactarius indigo]|nr:hypothetical protein H4582DRAFT_1036127 [Lactarius indigo]